MKRFALCIAVFTAMALVGTAMAGEDRAGPQLRLELDLVDGSHITGFPNILSVPVQTSYAKMDVPLNQILSIKMGEDHETAAFTLLNGDKLKSIGSLAPIKLEMVFGRVSIAVEHIRELRVVLAGRPLPEGLKRGLVLHYSFDRDEGGKATDLSGKGNHGIVHGAKWTRDGIAGGAYEFNGNGDYLDTGCNLSGVDEITVCGWVRPAKAQRGASVVTQFGGPPGDNVWGLFAQADHFSDLVPPHKGIVTVLTADGRRPTAWGKPTEIGKWAHLCFTFKRSGQVVLFKDGVSVGQDATGDSPLNKRDSTAKVGASWGADGYWANGLIDEVMVYNRALSGEEVKQLYDVQE
ncbi:MAG: LamG domain-containing protein [Planctomycetota bacterium]